MIARCSTGGVLLALAFAAGAAATPAGETALRVLLAAARLLSAVILLLAGAALALPVIAGMFLVLGIVPVGLLRRLRARKMPIPPAAS